MNEDLLASAVSEWLKASDSPPADAARSRSAAAARVRRAQQARSTWPRFGWGYWSPTSARRSAAFAVAVALFAFAVVGVFLLRPVGQDQVLLIGASPSTAPTETTPADIHGLDGSDDARIAWKTDVVDLRADGFDLLVGGRAFTTQDAPLAVRSDPGDLTHWTLELEWIEHDVLQRLALEFAADGGDWWLEQMRAYNGRRDGDWVFAGGPLLRRPLGEAYMGDLVVELGGGDMQPEDGGRGLLRLRGMELAVSPGEPGTRSGSPPGGQTGLDLAGLLLVPTAPPAESSTRDDSAAPVEPAATPRPVRGPGTPTELAYGADTLSGNARSPGIVRVFEDGVGNNTKRVEDMAMAPDGTVWIARDRFVFRLGQEGRYPLGGKSKAPIKSLEVRPDGGLEATTSDGGWLFANGKWTRLEAPERLPRTAQDGHFARRLADGSVWGNRDDWRGVGRLDGNTWIDYPLNEVFPQSAAAVPSGAYVRLRSLADGSVWADLEEGPPALSRFDGAMWREFDAATLDGITGDEIDHVRDLLFDEVGTTWAIASSVGGDEHLLMYVDGVWSSAPVPEMAAQVGLPAFDPRFLAPGLLAGEVQLYGWRKPVRSALTWDGEAVVVYDEGPVFPKGIGEDGTMLGLGRDRTHGLVAIPPAVLAELTD